MGRSDKRNHNIPTSGFIEQDFRMARSDYLIGVFPRHVNQQLVDLPLSKNFQMSVGLIEKKNRPPVGIKIRQEQENLLQSPSRRGQVEEDSVLPVAHADFATLSNVFRDSQFRAEEGTDVRNKFFPFRRFFRMNFVTEVTEHLGGPALADSHIDGPGIQQNLIRGQSGHGGKKCYLDIACIVRDQHPVRISCIRQAERPTVE